MQTLGRTKLTDEELFDNTGGYDDEGSVHLARGLDDEEVKQASILYKLFNELWGVCVVVGDPGAGKDLFGNYLAYKLKRYFPWKRILRDEKPRPLFGPYAGLFNEQVLKEELQIMRDVAKGRSAIAIGDAMDKAADRWVTGDGEAMLKNSVLYLTEYWRYCYNREPMNPMNRTMGAIHKMKRHLDCLIIGTAQLSSELDKKTCLPWIDWKVTCGRSKGNPTGFLYLVTKVKYDTRVDALVSLSRSYPIPVDAGTPRYFLGDGRIRLTKTGYRAETEEEWMVLETLRSGVELYEDMVKAFEDSGDLTEAEVLTTLKELKFNRRKRAVDYPCFFGLYNSKSAPQIKSSLKVEQ